MAPSLADVVLPDLQRWLRDQRWFSAKAAADGATVVDVAALPTATPSWAVTVQTGMPDDAHRWLVIAVADPDGPAALGTIGGTPVADISRRPAHAAELLTMIRSGGRARATSGALLTALPVGAAPPTAPSAQVRQIDVEQSNSSFVVSGMGGTGVILKVLRTVEAGPNPEVELTQALTRAGADGVPRMVGALIGPDDAALVVASGFVAGGVDGSTLAWSEVAARPDGPTPTLDALGELGGVLASIHAALRRALPTVESGADDADAWREELRREAADTVAILRGVLPADRADVAAEAVRASVADALGGSPMGLGRLQRIHGDLHLGQTLRDDQDRWWLIDFEGEPSRPIAARRMPTNPMRDVAGMLRSFSYARAQGERQGGDPVEAARWEHDARAAFLRGYDEVAATSGGARATDDEWLRAFEVHKLLYEVRYEAANRPDWIDIPLRALGVTEADMTDPTSPDDATSEEMEPAPTRAVSGPGAQAPPAATGEPPAQQSPMTPRHQDPQPTSIPLHDPHTVLGFHAEQGGWVARTRRPGATAVAYLDTADADPIPAAHVGDGLWEVHLTLSPVSGRYRWRVDYDDQRFDLVDPYGFAPTLGEIDIHLLAEGRHEDAWRVMGANRRMLDGIDGVAFTVWAPNAQAVRVVGEMNSWDGRLHPMRSLGSTGIWEVFVPDVADGTIYKYELVTADGALALRADPWASWTEVPPGTSSRVHTSSYEWTHDSPPGNPHTSPMSVYEVHLGSWRQGLDYREAAHQLAEHVTNLGFTHVELLPLAEHPFGGSWGYQVTGHFAPTSRFGDPDDFRYLVDHLHGRGVGVIIDWVPAHFPKDEWALRLFDGTALYEHEDPRLGEHPDWGTMVFNYGRREVKNFLLASALFWIEEMRVDGLRVDAVASMLYLDYSREAGEWVPNEHGGRENLRAVELLQEVNATVYRRNPHATMIAEESTAWPGVSRPTHLGGLGFGFKWNMGWMHDTLEYAERDPIYRRWHHNQLTFGLVYAFSENFVLPLSHDEVVHGKGSMIDKMPGDEWRQFANLRALYAWMWAHPGKQLLFMGQEFAQRREWSEERSLDWHLLDQPGPSQHYHQGMIHLIADLNGRYRAHDALWQRDADHEGFAWIDANDADHNLLSFLRFAQDGSPVAVVANMSASPQTITVGLPHAGHWREVLNSDAERYGGTNVGNLGGVEATDAPWQHLPASAEVVCPPLGVIWLAP